jgi:hypothetical protein
MKLHANAELSLNKRRRLVERVEQGWTLTKAGWALAYRHTSSGPRSPR